MTKCIFAFILLTGLSLALACPARGQTFEVVGTRAKGMGGAQVAAVDDASAAYWNPGGLASGAYFSLVVDWSKTTVNPPDSATGARQDGLFFGMTTPAFGITYYQLQSTAVRLAGSALLTAPDRDSAGTANLGVTTLSTHHLGGTIVQSLFEGVAIGATLKYVKGRAGADVILNGQKDTALDHGAALGDTSDREFDTDIGLMFSVAKVKAGVTVRNVLEPKFTVTATGDEVQLQRQARAGIAVRPGILTIAMDFDLLKTIGPFGDVKDMALGGEVRLGKRAYARSGFHWNTVSLEEVGHTPSWGFGGSFAVTSSVLIDGQVTTGSDKAASGWGISGRILY